MTRRDCWCGCGRQHGRSAYRVACRAQQVDALVTMLNERIRPLPTTWGDQELHEFIDYGEGLTASLLEVAHGNLPAPEVDRKAMKRWIALAATGSHLSLDNLRRSV